MTNELPPSDSRLSEAERIIAAWYRFGGTSADIDLDLWRMARNYCVKHRLPEPTEVVFT